MSKIYKDATLYDFGFKVCIKNAPWRNFEGEEILDLDLSRIADEVTNQLLLSTQKLTGNQVRFLRKQLRLTQQEVADALGRHQSNLSVDENKGDKLAFEEDASHMFVKLFFLKHRKKELENKHLKGPITETPFESFLHAATEFEDPETTFIISKDQLLAAG